jgi:hypothetical protein
MAMPDAIGREDMAASLGASIVAAKEVASAFRRPGISIPCYSARLKRVGYPIRVESFGKGRAAQIDDGHGLPTLAELLVCDRLRRSGWEAVWASTFGRFRFITSWSWDTHLPEERDRIPAQPKEVIDQIARTRCQRKNIKTSFGGIPDVIAWRNHELAMIECKRVGKDRLGEAQEEWLHCAFDLHQSNLQLGVFEWRFEDE